MSDAAVAGAAWASFVLVAAFRWRPAPARVRLLAAAPTASLAPARPSPVGLVGAALLSIVARVPRGRPVPGPRAHDDHLTKRVGTAALLAVPCVVAMPPATLPLAIAAAAVAGWLWPGLRAARDERRRLARLEADMPEVVDLLALAVEAGATVSLAVAAVVRWGTGPLVDELRSVLDEVGLGRRLGDALDDLPTRGGEGVRPLVAALVASERYGAPLGAGLERLGQELRRQRRQRAEESARRVPVKLLFPLVTCTLPAFGLLTVVPLVAGALGSLRL